MSQYFENDPRVESHPHIVTWSIADRSFSFVSDSGVFSKNQVDEGTQALLKVLLPLHPFGRTLDLGCGYGVIGLVLATFSPTDIFLLADVNERALALAKTNCEHLRLENVECVVSNLYENITGLFQSIVINPPIRAGKATIYKMFRGAYDHLNDGGSLFIVIRKSHGALSAAKFIESVFGNCTLLKKEKGYYIYEAKKENE